ncbi:MAG: hypothetical protein OMM_02272 [Candidatus Magnetoglobus multicellularis str. Araruama]|uniref:TIR domain-containing protein n=1 Tax=Candidatus Magnetoglobus multicellularis str. Araruama TaxID=890399 RepID=A0A1V1PA51_9BACT|nr:MAG: hypothetical protein OMM_02272 [Candidatus Magnetoglobus multicellularis str. Araruama]
MFIRESFTNWHWIAATVLATRCIRRVQPLLNSACGLGRDDGWEIECALSLTERMCTLSPHAKKRTFEDYSRSRAIHLVGYACRQIAEDLEKRKVDDWQISYHIARATQKMTYTVESANVEWDVVSAIKETFSALEHAKNITGSYKTIEADISLHGIMTQKDYNKLIHIKMKRGDSCNPTAIGPLGPIWSDKIPSWWDRAGLDKFDELATVLPHVFISYSHEDQVFVNELSDLLALSGVTCFKAERDIEPTSDWDEAIWNAIRGCRVFVSVLTPSFLKSRWLDLEVGAAKATNKIILPILRGVTFDDLPHPFDRIQSVAVETQPHMDELLKKLKSFTVDVI